MPPKEEPSNKFLRIYLQTIAEELNNKISNLRHEEAKTFLDTGD